MKMQDISMRINSFPMSDGSVKSFLFAILETRSRSLCSEVVNRRKNLALDLEDLNGGRHMQGVFIFLKKLLGISIPEEAQLNRLRIIRNCIAHWNGFVAACDNPKQVLGAVRQSKGSRIDSEGYVTLSRAYCDSALKLVIDYFTGVFDQLRFRRGSIRFSRLATRHGVSVEYRDGKWVCEVIEEGDVKKILSRKL